MSAEVWTRERVDALLEKQANLGDGNASVLLGLRRGTIAPRGTCHVGSATVAGGQELTGTLLVVCQECRQPMPSKPCVPAMDGQTSHGVCDACKPAYRARMLDWRNR